MFLFHNKWISYFRKVQGNILSWLHVCQKLGNKKDLNNISIITSSLEQIHILLRTTTYTMLGEFFDIKLFSCQKFWKLLSSQFFWKIEASIQRMSMCCCWSVPQGKFQFSPTWVDNKFRQKGFIILKNLGDSWFLL